MPFELRPEPQPTLRPEGEYLQRAWSQSVYPLARRMGVPIVLPPVSPQPHTHLAFEGYQYAREHGKGSEYNHRVLEAFFVEGRPVRSGSMRRNSGTPCGPATIVRRIAALCGMLTRRRASPGSRCLSSADRSSVACRTGGRWRR
jgi:hypothetical protein